MGDLAPEIERLRPLTLEELADRPPRKMLVKGLLGVGKMSVWFGEPKCGKSFLVTHLGLAIATSEAWFGKKVMQGPVLYVAAEGAGGFAKRIEAHRQHHGGIECAPFHVVLTGINLLDPAAEVEPLIYWAKETGAKLIAIDTLSRTMAGGNENSPEDMGAYIANCDHIREATGAHVLIVHHKPKGNNITPRGHSSLFGAVDALILVEKRKDGNVAKVEASKDEEEGWQFGFKLEVVEVGTDDDGDTITSCVVKPSDVTPSGRGQVLSGDQKLALEALQDVVCDHGRHHSGSSRIPAGAQVVDIRYWRELFYARKITKSDDEDKAKEAKKKAFQRAVASLQKAGKISVHDPEVWIVHHEDI